MSQQEIDEVLKKRDIHRICYPSCSVKEVEDMYPLPAMVSQTKTATQTTPPMKSNAKGSNKQSNNTNNTKASTSFGQKSAGNGGTSTTTKSAGNSTTGNTKATSTQDTTGVKQFSCLALTMAERSRQEAIREMMAKYLSLYPGVDNSYAEKLYKHEGKSCIYPAVVRMMKTAGYTTDHFQEAFDFYTWLPNHEPSPAEDPTKKTLIHYACLYSRPDILGLLLSKYSVNCGVKDEKGYTPFHEAAKSGNLACLELLYSKGFAYFDRRDVENRTSLMIAAFFNQKEAVKKLLEWGANADSKDSHQATAQDIARTLGHNEVAEIIRLFRREQSERNARATALKRWTNADPLNRRLYEAWQHSPNPHPSPVDNVQFNLTPVHNVEADNIELVRMNRYDVSSQRNYFGNPQGHNNLFLCLAYLGSPLICSRSDCLKALKSYEGTLRRTGLIEVHPLYFLAVIRLTKDDAPLRRTLLYDFVQQYPATLGRTIEKGGWLTVDEEKESLEEIESTKKEEAEPVPETIKDKWNAFAKGAKLTTAQREAMDELMNLTGLGTVKELAMDLYIEAQENGFKPPTGADGAPREYNFAFLGNPGTGKTTVARLLAKILEATGLRAGHKVLEMTASDALRKGVQQFSNELASLTGGDSTIGPPADAKLLRRGLNVEVLHGTKWFPGKVARVVKTQKPRPTPPAKPNEPPPVLQFDEVITYDVVYPDGTEDTGMTQHDAQKKLILRHVDKSTAAGGVLFLDEAYDLDPAGNKDGRHIMADIMKVAEDCRDRVSIILAGYKDDIENKLYAFNSGMRDRFRAILFEDFDENELLEVWEGLSKAAGWKEAATPGQMSVSRVAARRLAQRASVKGFANARSVRVMFNQSVAVAKRRPNHNKLLIVEDVIGVPPVPERIPALAAALKELHEHIGIPKVKEEVENLCDVARKNYDKELNGMKTDMIPLNRLFLGNPGTGKSTIASIYGRILKNLLLLSKGEVIERKASDFIGDVIGASETKTRGILSLAKGCVLIIDEAYNLNDGHFGKAALNTIVENVSNAPGSDIAVIMIGYEKNMLAMLNDQNPGLCSRFDPANAFRFEDFTDLELLQIFSSAAARDQVDVPIDIKCAAVRHLAKQRNMKNFGNARAVITLLGAAKSRMNSRMQKNPTSDQVMTLDDLLGEDANLKANPLQCIDELQGGDDEYGFRTVLRQLGNSINVCSLENRPYDPVGNFIFTGAPGTGKTTVASKMAKMLNAFGVLASNHVVVTTALDLTGQFVGQSKKVIEGKMEEARGGVLFIDEAYKLGEGSFGEEVMVKLLGMLTEPEYNNGKTIVILAGYEADMNAMLSRNAGMASRFNERIHFSDWTKEQCVDLVENMGCNEKPLPFVSNAGVRNILLDGFQELLKRPNWANARDSESMYKYLKKSRDRRRSNEVNTTTLLAHKNTENCLHFTEEDARMAVDTFLRNRAPAPAPSSFPFQRNGFPHMPHMPPPPPEAFDNFVPRPVAPPSFRTATSTAQNRSARNQNDNEEPEEDLCHECAEDVQDERVEELDEDYNNPDPNADQFSAAHRAELEQKRREHEARMAADAQEYAELLAREAANAAEIERMKAEQLASDKRHAELVAAEKKRVEDELAELARIEAERKAAHEAEMERIRLAHEEALRKAEAARQEALRREQEAEQKRLREEAEARRKAHEAEMERRRLVAEQEARDRAAAEAARKVREAEEKRRLEAERARTAQLLAEQQKKLVEVRKQEVVRKMGLCEAGYVWQKVSGGYRCAGGSHYVSDSAVDSLYNRMYN